MLKLKKPPLYTMTEVARLYGMRVTTISEVAGQIGIRPKRMSNHLAKGLDAGDLRKLERSLGPPNEARRDAIAALANAVGDPG